MKTIHIFDNAYRTIPEISKITGTPGDVISARYADGMSIIESARTKFYPSKRYEFAGNNFTLARWSEETGIRADTIRERLYRRWPLHRALTEPKMTRAQRLQNERDRKERG